MIKKKASKKTKAGAGKKRPKRKGKSKLKKELTPAEVRKDITRLVEESSAAIAEAVVTAAKMGQLAPAKYLWEMTGVFPGVTDDSVSTSEEDSLAKTLLARLNIPTEPVKLDEDEAATVAIPATKELGEGKPITSLSTEDTEARQIEKSGAEIP